MFGLIGFVWAFAWWRWFRDEPADHPAVNAAERELIERGRLPAASHDLTWKRWVELFSNASILGLCGMYFTQSYGFMFYITWLPTYLKTERGFTDPFMFSVLSGLPLTFSVAADLFGGIASDRMSRRYGLRRGRALVGGGSLFLAGLLLIAGVWTPQPLLAAILIGLGGGMSAFLLGAAWSTCLDIGGNHSGVVSAAMNTSGQVGAFICPILTGYMVQWYDYWTFPIYLTGVLYCLGALCWAAIDPRRPVWGHAPEPVAAD
jgi:MFS family permease